MNARLRAAAAGAAAASVWGFQEPLDRRVFGCDYSDVAVLGKALTRGRGWWPIGLAGHAVNGALTNGRAFAQATWRHTLFGSLLGRLA